MRELTALVIAAAKTKPPRDDHQPWGFHYTIIDTNGQELRSGDDPNVPLHQALCLVKQALPAAAQELFHLPELTVAQPVP